MKQLGNSSIQRREAISKVEEQTIWEGIEYIQMLPKLEKSLQNTIFEWVDWGTGEIVKPVTGFEVIIVEDEESEKILFENLDFLLIPTVERCTEVFYNKMKHTVNVLKIVSNVDLPLRTADIDKIVDERTDTHPIDLFKSFEVTISMEPKKITLWNKVKCTMITSVIIPHPMYFCISCNQDLCKTCFTSNCISHNVVWIGNISFECVSLYHRNRKI